MRILLVDDDPVSLATVQRVLENEHHSVMCCSNGEDAWLALQRENFEVVLCDWYLPGIDGLELCRRLRGIGGPIYTYFVIFTAIEGSDKMAEAISAGADDFLRKPIIPADLYAWMEIAQRVLRMNDEVRRKSVEVEQLGDVLQVSNRRISEMFRNLPIPVVTIGDEGLIMEWNAAAESLFRLKTHEVWMKPLWEVIVSSRNQRAARELVWAALGTDMIANESWCYTLRDGRKPHLMISTFALKSTTGDVIGSAICMVDITQQKRLERELKVELKRSKDLSRSLEVKTEELQGKNVALQELSEQLELLATTDGLTGLNNYRTFKKKLKEAMTQARDKGIPVSIILTDVDKFKTFNDEFGHLVGDEVLRKVAAIFKTKIARTDHGFIGRYGGEEFVAILPHATRDEALEFAEILRAGVEKEHWPWRQVTSSFGIATWSPELDDEEEFVKAADTALYHAKESGRNQSWHFDQLPQNKAA